jgi:PAS domain S-box-containing protein
MAEREKTKKELSDEIKILRNQIAKLETANTERERTRETLRESERLYHEFFATSRDSVFITSADGKWVDFNNATVEMFRYDGWEELSRVPIASLYVNPEERSTFLSIINKQGYVKEYPVQLKRKDGTVIDTLITTEVRQNKDASKKEYYGTIRDITEHKRMNEALLESERKIRGLFDQSFQFIGMTTPDGTLIEANKTSMRFSGIKESDCLGKPFWDTPWWTHSVELQNKLREAVIKVAGGETVRFEATHVAADKSIHYIDFSLKPVKDENGKIIFLIPEGRDITDIKKSEEETRKYTRELEVFYKASIGREERIIELKKEIEMLKNNLNEKK